MIFDFVDPGTETVLICFHGSEVSSASDQFHYTARLEVNRYQPGAMGKWNRQHLIVEPGDRNVDEVAGHLRASLASLDRPRLSHPEREVDIRNGQVYWDSGQRYTQLWQFLDENHADLDVPCEWMVGVYQHEVDSSGRASLYTWVDGEFALVETTPNSMLGDESGVRFLRTQWGVDPTPDWGDEMFPPLSDPPSVDWERDCITDATLPLVRFAVEFADESVRTQAAAQKTLAATTPDVLQSAVEALAERVTRVDERERVDALEQLYAAAASSVVPVEVVPAPVLDQLDETGRPAMLAAAIVRELSTQDAAARVTDGNPTVRQQAAQYLGLEGASQSVDPSVIEALADENSHVRAGIARSLLKLTWSRLNTPGVFDGEASEAMLFERLSAVVDDESPSVRAGAVPAVAFLAFSHQIGDEDVALSAIAAQLDEGTTARHSVEWLIGTYFWNIDGPPASLATLTATVITTFGDHPLVEILSEAPELTGTS